MAKGAAPRLTDAGIKLAVETLDSWQGKLTWDLYTTALSAESRLGHKYTKAALSRHKRIDDAFKKAKERVRGNEGSHGTLGLRVAQQRIRELTEANERLQREQEGLLEQFQRWAHNAVQKGLTPEELDRPVPVTKGQ